MYAFWHQLVKKLLGLGVPWESFRHDDDNKPQIANDLVQSGIPIVAASDIVALASQPSMAPMAIFWDLENIPIPAGISGSDIVQRIKAQLAPHGHVVQFRAYAWLGLTLIPPNQRSQLQLRGCHLVDCPHGGKKDVVDKMIIVDAMQFAHEQADKATICFITGDVDYANLLSVLQQNTKWRTIVITSEKVSSKLHENCHVRIIWEKAIVEPILSTTLQSSEIEGQSVVGNTGPIVNIPGEDASKVQKNDFDRELIRNAILDLSRKYGTTIHRKARVLNALREMNPYRFPNRKAINSFLFHAIADGVIEEQGKGEFKTLALSEAKGEGSCDKTLPSLKANMAPPIQVLSLEETDSMNSVWLRKSQMTSSLSWIVDSNGNFPSPDLHVSGFGPGTTKQEVFNLFRKYANVLQVVEKTYAGKHFMFVNTTHTKDAVTARERLQGTILNDGILKINFAKRKV